MGGLKRLLVVAVLALGLPAVVPTAIPAQETATEIVVTNNSDALNGDTSSAASLTVNPGQDGVSLREAIETTNNDPGIYTVRFDASLSGQTITISGPPEATPLMLTGGEVTIDGDIDGDLDPDVTIIPEPSLNEPVFIMISSTGNRLHALALQGFHDGVILQANWHPDSPGEGEFPTHQTYSDNVVEGLVMDVGNWAISVVGNTGSDCGAPGTQIPCPTYNTWANTSITNNTIEAVDKGIQLFLVNGTEDRVDGATITDNVIRMGVEDFGDPIHVAAFGNATRAEISGVLIARNDIEGPGSQGGVSLVGGPPEGNTIEGVRILDNRIRIGTERGAGQGITLQPGECHEAVQAVCNKDGNVLRDVVIRGNTITGSMIWVVNINGGIGSAGQNNLVADIRIVGNTLRTNKPTFGILASAGDGSAPPDRHSTGNRITSLVIKANRIRIGTGPNFRDAGGGIGAAGIALVGGHHNSRDDAVRNIKIAKNSIRTAYIGIRVIGGLSSTARRNRVICVPRFGNSIVGARKRTVVRSNVDGGIGNRATLAC